MKLMPKDYLKLLFTIGFGPVVLQVHSGLLDFLVGGHFVNGGSFDHLLFDAGLLDHKFAFRAAEISVFQSLLSRTSPRGIPAE